MNIQLKGMTWNHARGYDPLVACSAEWHRKTGVEITWDKRSLQDFESFPVDELARQYDLIIIDHPHVGQVVKEGCLRPLDEPRFGAALKSLAEHSVGPSFISYAYGGRQWALPVDASTIVQAYAPTRINGPAKSWGDVLRLATEGKVALPLRPPHSLMCLYTLMAHFGTPCQTEAPPFLTAATAKQAYEFLCQLCQNVDPVCYEQDPIAVFEGMTQRGSSAACIPMTCAYVNYAIDGFRSDRIDFANIPVDGTRPPNGSGLAGTGLAVSARSKFPDAAMDFAFWVASGEVQRTLYAHSNGQAGHADAWEDVNVNDATHGFYLNTRATYEGAWVRPRHNGYMPFQQLASEHLNDCLRSRAPLNVLVEKLNALFAASFQNS